MSTRYTIDAVHKAVSVLVELASQRHPAALADIARAVNLPKDQTFRVLMTFQEDGLAEQVGDRWIAGTMLIVIGNNATVNRITTWKQKRTKTHEPSRDRKPNEEPKAA